MRSRQFLEGQGATVLLSPRAGPDDHGNADLGRQRGPPWAAGMGTHCQGGLSWIHLGVCQPQAVAASKPSPVHFSKARSSWFFPSGRKGLEMSHKQLAQGSSSPGPLQPQL